MNMDNMDWNGNFRSFVSRPDQTSFNFLYNYAYDPQYPGMHVIMINLLIINFSEEISSPLKNSMHSLISPIIQSESAFICVCVCDHLPFKLKRALHGSKSNHASTITT